MSTSSISSAITEANTEFNSAVATSSSGSDLDKDSFMLLLVTQFKYQDPLDPADNTEFVAQLATFSSLEQLINLNDSMDSLLTATNEQTLVNATSYIGKNVTISGDSIGKVTDSDGNMTVTTFRYAPSSDVASGTISVYDSDSNIVYSETLGSLTSGTTYSFTWSGYNSSGTLSDDGTYTVSLSLLDSDGEAVLSDQVVDAVVTGVVNQDDTIYLGLDGGQLMELSNVRQVTESTSTSTTDSTSTDSTSS
jgi:flagellar basal-body rod modification protein FlgD